MPKLTNTIAELTSTVFDNGRRVAPRPGCDCRQCFGYCMIDRDIATRENLLSFDKARLTADFGFNLKTLEILE